jgi:sterol 14alpha-demethylase
MEQKKVCQRVLWLIQVYLSLTIAQQFIKFGLSSEALQSYVPLMEKEVRDFLKQTSVFQSPSGIVDIPKTMAQITLFTASRSLQGKEIREKLNSTYAELYHDLDDGFTPLNFMLPWAPLPQNRRRDIAQKKMTQLYTDIIRARRENGGESDSKDMMWNLMNSAYKDGTPVPDHEIAHMMTGLLMAGQHSSSVTSAWTMLRLASQPDIMEELYQEQRGVLGDKFHGLRLEDLQKLSLCANVVRETLRVHPPIHSIMRKATNTLQIEGTNWVVPAGHVLLAAPATMSFDSSYFPNPAAWDPHRWDTIADPDADVKDKVDYGFGPTATGANSTYLPFGAGRHRCIGEHFAFLQLTLVIAIMVQEFKFQNLPGQAGVVETDYSVCTFSLSCHEILVTPIHSLCFLARNGLPISNMKRGTKAHD